MRKTLSILMFFLLAAAAFGNGTNWFKGSFEEAKDKARKEGKLILIDFYSDG